MRRKISFLLAFLLITIASPILNSPLKSPSPDILFEEKYLFAGTNNVSISPANGWTTGGEEITISGSGFLDMAFKNVTNDGKPYTWTTNTVNYVAGSGYSPSIAVDSNGTVHIVHVLWKDDQLWHSKLVAGASSWSHSKIMECNGCRETDMAIDSNDNLHIAYYLKQTGTTGYLYYGVFDGSTWTTQSLQNNVYNTQIRIALDTYDRPHISYANAGTLCNGAMLKYYDGATWITQAIDTTTTYVGCDTSIAIDNNGYVHVAYRHQSNKYQMIGSNISGSWQRYTVDNGNDVGYYTDVVVDHDNNLQMLYRTNAAGGQYKHATGLSGSAWSDTTYSGGYSAFRMQTDALGNIHASMYDTGSDDLVYQILVPDSNNQWSSSIVDSAGNVGSENDIFVDDNNMIHIAYYDTTNEALKYANKSSGMYLEKEITVDFGIYGRATGNVLNDTTIVVTTPPAGSMAETVNLSLYGEDGNQYPLGVGFLFISPDDVDMDGVLNVDDDCPNTAGNSTIDRDGCPDFDGDGYSDENDDYPTNPYEWQDSDFDGVGDNSDVFPNDSSEWLDSDGDGVGDNRDAFPYDANETMDSDNDGVGDNADMFPNNAFEYLDSDNDGVGDNSDAFPFDPEETMDSDNDGVGDNADAFPNDPSETMDSDGDGIGDNSDSHPFINNFLDSDGDQIPDLQDAFPADMTQWVDSDGDGYGDNATGTNPDAFANIPTQWSDIDGDGYGDNWGNGSWNESRSSSGIGQYVNGAVMADYCPEVVGNSTASGFFGCADDDGDGIANIFEQEEVILDADGDGVLDEDDQCPNTPFGTPVDTLGCTMNLEKDDEVVANADGFFSSEVGQVVGLGGIILAILTLLQTNIATAILPDAFRWVQVFRNNSKLTKEEENELAYLQSLVQAYFQEPGTLAEELRLLKSDLTARLTNNEIKAQTREKINVLINDLLQSSAEDLVHIAHNDAYFGLVATVNAAERTELLQDKLAMSKDIGDDIFAQATFPPLEEQGIINHNDGYEWLEYPKGSGVYFHRTQNGHAWTKWEN